MATEREASRHNVADETETRRSHVANEGIAQFNAYESQRHNLEVESINRFQAQETSRHNQVAEYLQGIQLDEVKRHNLKGEAQNAFKIRGEQAVREQEADTNTYKAKTGRIDSNIKAAQTKADIVLGIRSANQQDWHLRNETAGVVTKGLLGSQGLTGLLGGLGVAGGAKKAIGFLS